MDTNTVIPLAPSTFAVRWVQSDAEEFTGWGLPNAATDQADGTLTARPAPSDVEVSVPLKAPSAGVPPAGAQAVIASMMMPTHSVVLRTRMHRRTVDGTQNRGNCNTDDQHKGCFGSRSLAVLIVLFPTRGERTVHPRPYGWLPFRKVTPPVPP